MTCLTTLTCSTTYLYDLIGRKTSTQYPDNSTNTIAYDVLGYANALRFTYESGKSKTFVTDFDGTIDKVEYRDTTGTLAGTDDFDYDAHLRRDGSTSMDGITRGLTYNDNGQLATDTTSYGGQSYVVTYGYDNRLRQNSITYPSGRVASYSFTNRGELDTISWAGTQVEDRLYDAGGRLTNIDRAHTDEVRVYDTSNRLASIDNKGVGKASYIWDANSNKLSETWTGAMASHSFTTEKAGATQYADGYDEEDRFRRFNQTGQSSDIFLARSDIGNVSDVQVNSNSNSRSYSPAHELVDVAGVTQTFDDDGNLTNSHTGIALGWNAANRLNQTVVSSTATTGIEGTNDYGYDSSNKRCLKKITRNGTTAQHTVYMYAGPNCIAEYNSGTAAASPEQEYVYGQSIDSLVLLSRNGDADRSIVTRNQQWSVAALLDASNGSVQERYTYDHFGKRTALEPNGTTVRAASNYNMPYGYTCRRHDPESDLIYFRARFYDPTTGEFTSRDSLEYVDGMSLMRGYLGLVDSDPFGLRKELTLEELHSKCKKNNKIYKDLTTKITDDPKSLPEISNTEKSECNKRIEQVFADDKHYQQFGALFPLTKIWEQFGEDCPRPQINCECCPGPSSGSYELKDKSITICWNRFQQNTRASNDLLYKVLTHEGTHALQGCYYFLPPGCIMSLKWELEAYYCGGDCDDFSSCMARAINSSCFGWCSAKHFKDDRLLNHMRLWFNGSKSEFCNFRGQWIIQKKGLRRSHS